MLNLAKKGKNVANILFTCYKFPHSQSDIHLQLTMSGMFVTIAEVKFSENYLR